MRLLGNLFTATGFFAAQSLALILAAMQQSQNARVKIEAEIFHPYLRREHGQFATPFM